MTEFFAVEIPEWASTELYPGVATPEQPWLGQPTKLEIPTGVAALGFVPGEQFKSEYLNWYLNRISRAARVFTQGQALTWTRGPLTLPGTPSTLGLHLAELPFRVGGHVPARARLGAAAPALASSRFQLSNGTGDWALRTSFTASAGATPPVGQGDLVGTADGQWIIVGHDGGRAIYRSNDQGGSWATVNNVAPSNSTTRALHRTGSGRILAGSKTAGFASTELIQSSDDGGASWDTKVTPAGNLIHDFADNGDGIVLAATADISLGSGWGLLRSVDDGDSWADVSTLPVGTSRLNGVTYNSTWGLFFAKRNGGVVVSADGAAWSALTIADATTETTIGSSTRPGREIASQGSALAMVYQPAVGQVGVMVSFDAGATWSYSEPIMFTNDLGGVRPYAGGFVVWASDGRVAVSSPLGLLGGDFVGS